ncbi:MAG: hypothetical protein V7L23_23175 [Nostoc sp.]|uniref:hypothetical protein n=1 Tax=Nostoc sp. TaxID=1180 RepID=UPI002FF0E437
MTGQTIKISSLQQRYKLNSRQAVNNRINGLKIDPVARGEISAEQLELLDRLDKHIRGGGAIADFPIQPEVQVDKLDILDKPERRIEFNNSEATTINIMAELMEKMMSYTYTRDSSPLASYEELEKAAEFEWILPTSKIKELIGVPPKTTHDSDTFIRGSFAFIKQGKIGSETGWQVTKQVPKLDLKWLNPVRLST